MDNVSHFRPWEPRAARPAGTGCVGAAKGKKMWIKEGEARTLHGLGHDAGRRTEFGFVDLLHVLDLWVNDSDRNTASVSHFSQFRYPVRARRIAASDGAAGQKNCCLNVLVIF